ncbi:acetyl-CoA acetyltransferase [Sandarakinorhabdus oryzae]|uniref:acetyl-CoA acetyltransferase n=1 Tax=Sandarakinorhabdus oryzae TaxID=2675220 RepID=UPI0012E103FA|nr:acetyl-CoA acetyltransferase [Sandarakinorhabdus oryzae]
MSLPAERTPVIIGVGEVLDRPADPAAALEPLALMEAAVRAADADAGGGFLERIDSLDVINLVSWRYDKVAQRLAERLGITPPRAVYAIVGGETPTTKIHEAALRIMNGNSVVAVVTGGEAQNAVAKAKAAGITLPWTPPSKTPENPIMPSDHVTPLGMQHGIFQPIHIYPLYENATVAAWGLTPRQALAESGAAYERISAVAATNPYAWGRKAFTAEEITTVSDDNRMICWPYTKRMVANNNVNAAAAVLMTTLAAARAAGIAEDRIIHVHGGAAAGEHMDYLKRDQYVHSCAQDAVLGQAVRIAPNGFDRVELYSCFPTVPKMARRTLGLGPDVPLSVTGGLSFAGAGLNCYMLHSTCAMVRSLRDRPADQALLYGQGGYVTKHHALVIGNRPAEAAWLMLNKDVQEVAEDARADVPPYDGHYAGPARLETYSIVFGREGQPSHGSVVGRTPDGARVFGKIDVADADALATLLSLDAHPIGLPGMVSVADDGLQRWAFA